MVTSPPQPLPPPERPWQAILFDFDGVLVESAEIKIAAFRALYAEHGAQVVDRVIAHHTAHGGISRRQKIRLYHREFLGIALAPEALDGLCGRFSGLVEDAVVNAPAVRGAAALLAAASGRAKLFVVSGTPQAELERIAARRGIAGYFAEIHGSPPEKAPIIHDILARHDLAADHVVFVGDSMTDYVAAADTGIAFVGRVRPGGESPFPAGTGTVPDLTEITPP